MYALGTLFHAVLLACAILLPSDAWAQRSQADCEKISDDDAYNKCLAASGPTRQLSRSSAAGREESPSQNPHRRGRAAQYTPVRARAGWQVQRIKGGRVRMVIPMTGRRR